MRIENTAQALTYLNSKKGFDIEKINENLFQDHYSDGEPINYTARELIKLAKVFTSENNQQTAIKKNVKKFTNDKNRTATRDLLKTEEFDKIPQSGIIREDDIWYWD